MSTKIPLVPLASHSQCSMCSRYCIVRDNGTDSKRSHYILCFFIVIMTYLEEMFSLIVHLFTTKALKSLLHEHFISLPFVIQIYMNWNEYEVWLTHCPVFILLQSKHEIIRHDVVHKICSDTCFLRFCNINNLSICENCHSSCSKPLMLSTEDGNKKLCDAECLAQFKQVTES